MRLLWDKQSACQFLSAAPEQRSDKAFGLMWRSSLVEDGAYCITVVHHSGASWLITHNYGASPDWLHIRH